LGEGEKGIKKRATPVPQVYRGKQKSIQDGKHARTLVKDEIRMAPRRISTVGVGKEGRDTEKETTHNPDRREQKGKKSLTDLSSRNNCGKKTRWKT